MSFRLRCPIVILDVTGGEGAEIDVRNGLARSCFEGPHSKIGKSLALGIRDVMLPSGSVLKQSVQRSSSLSRFVFSRVGAFSVAAFLLDGCFDPPDLSRFDAHHPMSEDGGTDMLPRDVGVSDVEGADAEDVNDAGVSDVSAMDAEPTDGGSVGITVLPEPVLDLAAPPLPGVHPRVLISPSELPGLRKHLVTSAVGQSSIERMRLAAQEDTDVSRQLMFRAFLALIDDDAVAGVSVGTDIAERAVATGGVVGDDPDHQLALAYDFAYDFIGPTDRDTIRTALSMATFGQRSYGMDETVIDREAPPNWQPYGMNLLLTALAIEDEPGYDASIYGASLALLNDFLTYEIFTDGATKEEMHYFNYGMNHGSMAMIAMAKRGDDLFGHPQIRRLHNWYVHSIEPFGYRFSEHWDSFTDSRNGGITSMYAALKFAWPADPVIDYVYRHRMKDNYSGSGDRFGLLMNTIFGRDYRFNQPGSALGLGNTYYSSERGFLITRDQWDSQALVLHFENRRNHHILGHTHADRNNFTLSALGKRWAVDWGFGVVQSYDHNVVTIDGRGQEYYTPPGEIVSFADEPVATVIIGDAEYAYDYRWTTRTRTTAPQNAGYDWEPEPNQPVSNNPLRRALSPNAVERAFRIAVLVRGPQPYILIIDDIQKDDVVHQYQWLMQLDDEVSLLSNEGSDLILENQPARLLVRVLAAAAAPNMEIQTTTIERWTDEGPYTSLGEHRRVNIEVQAVAPDFRILLFPHMPKTPLPRTEVQDGILSVKIDEAENTFEDTFVLGQAEGRPTIRMSRNGTLIFER